MSQASKPVRLSRREVLIGGVFVGGAYALAAPLLSSAASTGGDGFPRFMHLSQLLINHRLDEGVGRRIHGWASNEHADFATLNESVISVAESKQAKIVEDFFGDIPAGPARDMSLWIISAWYSGCSSAKPDAAVFAFEEALTYQTSIDVVTIPSYGVSGPDLWSHETTPLLPMPEF